MSISPALVEPGIALTIVGMAVFDLWQRHRARWATPALQMGLVFACALVHGLGFASALGSLGLSGAPLVWSLAGFNLGIEAAQVGVAALAAAGMALLARWVGLRALGGPLWLRRCWASCWDAAGLWSVPAAGSDAGQGSGGSLAPEYRLVIDNSSQ